MKYALVSDNFCYKFLKARKFTVAESVKLFRSALEHRRKYDLDHILDKPCPVVRYLATRYPHTFWGYDKNYLPLYCECIGDIDAAKMAEDTSFEELLHYHRWTQEFLQRKVVGGANYKIRQKLKADGVSDDTLFPQIDQMVFITNIGSASMATLRSVDYMKAIAGEDSIGYPELMHKTWIINAGFIFKTAYAIAKPFLDPGTTAKFNIIRSDGAKEMAEEMGAEHLPEFLKGTRAGDKVVNFKYFDSAEEMARQAKEHKEQLKDIKKAKKDGSYEEPAPEVKYALPPVEVLEMNEENSARIAELKLRANAKGEDASMWMRMCGEFTERVFFLAEHGLDAYENVYESDRIPELVKCRRGDAVTGGYYGESAEAAADAEVAEVSVVQDA